MYEYSLKEQFKEAFEYGNTGDEDGYKISIPGGRMCSLTRTSDSVSLFIECSISDFKDNFNEATIESIKRNIKGGNVINGLELKCPNGSLSPFISLSCDLLNYLHNNDFDNADIQKWCDEWKGILGNRYSEKRIYDVLSELIVFDYLQTKGFEPSWSGPDNSRHDIFCKNFDCEVKSTLKRTGNVTIEVSSWQQFNPGTKALFLFVCQLEEAKNGDFSIETITESLISHNADIENLQKQLKKTGITSTENKNKRFNMISDLRMYEINDDFPRLTEKSFKNDTCPEHIFNIRYSLDLDSLEFHKIFIQKSEDSYKYILENDQNNE